MTATDKVFTGSIPAIYDSHLGPMLFAPYAADLAERVMRRAPTTVLETAAGTGLVSTEIVRRMSSGMAMTVTDLNQAMLDIAARRLPPGAVQWKVCDAMQLPFADAGFDVVACQFGVMFFPDKVKAYSEARRVLRRGGAFLFNVWDSLAANLLPAAIHESVAAAFPDNPPGFFARTPHGYFDATAIRGQLEEAGFTKVESAVVTLGCNAPSARHVATGFCQGTPLRNEIEARGPGRLDEITDLATAAVEARFGSGPIESTMCALVFEASA